MKSADADDVRRRAEGRWVGIVATLAPKLKEAVEAEGKKHVACPFHDGVTGDGLRAFRDVGDTGGVICNTCGPRSDGFATLMWANGWNFNTAVNEVANLLGGGIPLAPAEPPEVKEKKQRQQARDDRRTQLRLITAWKETLPLDDPQAEPVRKYLASRGLPLPDIGNVRFHPAMVYFDKVRGKFLGKFPTMLARVSRDGVGLSLHRTFLTSDGRKADVPEPKKLMSTPSTTDLTGAAIQLFPAAKIVGVAEGIETALAATALTGTPCWSCVSDTLLMGFQPPAGIEEVLVFADKDANGAGEHHARELQKRLWEEGIKASLRLPPPRIPEGKKGIDWNDVLLMGNVKRRA